MDSSRLARVRSGLFFLAIVGPAILATGDAGAVVEQTDGLVVPIQVANCPGSGVADGCIQVGLNIGEGLAATAQNNPLNAIFDAVTTPEIFSIPKNNNVYGNVVVTDLIEGAGYENSFGWYNVTNPGTLYVVTPCADEPTSTRTINFQTEFTLGHYLGGFIGFFLITPENQPVATNCGAIGDVGHIYYTEQAKNGDGNYVHYLLYHSKKDPLAYYFGFEDLYRGGDNDFEDMFLKVTGLLAPCVPSNEVCDGKDNNCDGLIDNSPVDAGGPCGATDEGECSYGVLTCQAGGLICVGYQGPTAEQCNGKDDDCDGVVDNNASGVGQACGTDVGECSYGAQQCIGGALVCVGGKGPSLETCNSLDDDCDGVIDNATIDAGGACGLNIGVCQPGTLTCTNGMITCVGGTSGSPEQCNGLDDDCNGAIDDGDPGGGAACGTDVGACEPGVEHCVGGQIICVGAIGPSEEICDGLDNDCDGVGDNLAPCPGMTKCIQGTCASPCGAGEFDCPGGQVCSAGYCVPATCDTINCPPGQTCMQGICVNEGAGGAGGQGGGGPGGGGPGGGGPGGAGPGGGSEGGGKPSTTSSSSGSGETGTDAWGLPTGGGGLKCAFNIDREGEGGRSAIATLLLGALAFVVRRRPASNKKAASKNSGERLGRSS